MKMVKFEEMLEKMAGMSPEELKAAAEENTRLCTCSQCPSYVGTGETALLFCASGRSERISEEKGCICMGCPVTPKMGLRWGYYCTRGSAKEMLESEKR